MNGVRGSKGDPVPRMQLFNCMHADCGATFTRQWRLKEHETTHTGARPVQCKVAGCGRSFSRKSHLKRHALQHGGVKKFKCGVATCGKGFLFSDKLKRHLRCAHSQKDKYFKCNFTGCAKSFKKRRALKLHQSSHGVSSFKCSSDGCLMKFDSHVARNAHERTHKRYTCPRSECSVTQNTWGKMLKHMAGHQAVFPCPVCKKEFRKRDSLRRHKRTHSLQKPVLLCPQQGCQAYFSTTFNLQHHIRKQHLQLLRHRCSFPECNRAFAMRCVAQRQDMGGTLQMGGMATTHALDWIRESLARHLIHHDPDAARLKRRQRRSSKSWQKRLDGHGQHALVEQDLRGLFAMRMRLSRRAKLEADLTGLFNERKVPHRVEPETNLRELFSLKPPRAEIAVNGK